MTTTKSLVPSGIITLLTDFGTTDPFVGVMKGVVLSLTSRARLVDLTHAIPPQQVPAAAFWLSRSYGYFPPGTVHLAVVDPGVGTSRRALALQAQGHFFVGPDNGLFSGVLDGARAIHHIDADSVRAQLATRLPGLGAPSATFHGRDVFAPAAAILAAGGGLAAVGPPLMAPEPVLLDRTTPRVEVVDHFGNLITGIDWDPRKGEARIRIRERTFRWVRTYGEAEVGECVALLGSLGTIEIAVRDGNAARELGVGAGEPVILEQA